MTAPDAQPRPEEWRSVPGAPGYEASDRGRVRSWRGPFGKTRKAPRLRKPVRIKKGYMTISLMRAGRPALLYVHHMVLDAFMGERPEGTEARHGDGDSTNNRLDNLSWATHVDNESDKDRHGTHTRGERNGGAKLTQFDAEVLRARLSNGERGRDLAVEYEVSQATVSRIKKGLRYVGT